MILYLWAYPCSMYPQSATTPMLLTLLLGLLQLNYKHQKPNQKRKNLCIQNLENLFQDPQEDQGIEKKYLELFGCRMKYLYEPYYRWTNSKFATEVNCWCIQLMELSQMTFAFRSGKVVSKMLTCIKDSCIYRG